MIRALFLLRTGLVLLTASCVLGACVLDAPIARESADGGLDAVIPDGDDGLRPRLLNFRIQDPERNRIYFDSSEAIVATNANGFIVPGAAVVAITVIPNSETGHYFTASEPFTFWDNHLIRYEEGSDLTNREGNAVYPFLQQYVRNTIPEPVPTGRAYYVSTEGNDTADGLSEAAAWRTLTFALSGASPVVGGDVVHVRAGNYGAERFVTRKNENATEDDPPILISGYRSTPGDNPDLGWRFPENTDLDSAVMPLFQGDGTGTGFEVRGDNLIFKNLQVADYGTPVFVTAGPERVNLDNIIAARAASTQFAIHYNSDAGFSNRIENSVAYNAGTVLMRLYGSHMLVQNVTCVQDADGGVGTFIETRGDGNIVRNSQLATADTRTSTANGISVKGNSVSSEYGLYENLEITNVGSAIQARHDEVRYNVYRNIQVTRGGADPAEGTGIAVLNGASFNTFENIVVRGGKFGVLFSAGGEDPEATTVAHDNLFRNCVFSDVSTLIRAAEDSSGRARETYANSFVNSVFYGGNRLFFTVSPQSRDNTFVNSIFMNIPEERGSGREVPGFSYQNCDVFGDWTPSSGEGNLAEDPVFVNADGGDFHLQAASPAGLRNGGLCVPEARYDFDGRERIQGSCSIGAFEQE